MLKRFLIKMLIAGVFLLLFSIRFIDTTIGEQVYEYPLETAWKATGLTLTEVDTETWLRLNNRWLNRTELKNLALEIQDKLGLKLKTRFISGEQTEFSYISFEGLRRDGTIVSVTIQSNRANDLNETQLGVSTVKKANFTNLKSYIEDLKSSLKSLGTEAHISIVLQGEKSGKLTPLLVKEISGKALRRLQANLVQSEFSEGYTSQKGYSNLIEDAVVFNAQQVNIEINTRYDPDSNQTEVVMATPNLNDGV